MKKFFPMKAVLGASAMMFMLASCQEDELVPTIEGLPEGDVSFVWNSTESETITVNASADWTFEVQDEHDIIDVERPEGTNDLVITPSGPNYASKEYSALVTVIAGSGSAENSKTISVVMGANDPTFISFVNAEDANIEFNSELGGEPMTREIQISTNNEVSVVLAEEGKTVQPMTKTDIPGLGWLSYTTSVEHTEDADLVTLVLTCQVNPDAEDILADIDIVAGNDRIENTVEKVTAKIINFAAGAAIILNPEEMLFGYDSEDAQPLSILANVEYTYLLEGNVHWVNDSEGEGGSWTVTPMITPDPEKEDVYLVTVPISYSTSPRSILLSIGEVNPPQDDSREPLNSVLKVVQEAAPAAEANTSVSTIVLNSNQTEDMFEFMSSMPKATVFSYLDKDGETVSEEESWFKAVYREWQDSGYRLRGGS